MAKHCNCKADKNLQQLRTFFNRGKDEKTDSPVTVLKKHVLRLLGNAVVILAVPIAIPFVLLHVRKNEKKGLGRVFKFNTNKWQAYINHELTNYRQQKC